MVSVRHVARSIGGSPRFDQPAHLENVSHIPPIKGGKHKAARRAHDIAVISQPQQRFPDRHSGHAHFPRDADINQTVFGADLAPLDFLQQIGMNLAAETCRRFPSGSQAVSPPFLNRIQYTVSPAILIIWPMFASIQGIMGRP